MVNCLYYFILFLSKILLHVIFNKDDDMEDKSRSSFTMQAMYLIDGVTNKQGHVSNYGFWDSWAWSNAFHDLLVIRKSYGRHVGLNILNAGDLHIEP